MANDKDKGTEKAKRNKVTTKPKNWTGADDPKVKLLSRPVKSVYGPEKKPIAYTEVKLRGVSDPAEAMTLLKVKGSRAVAALVKGVNSINRANAGTDSGVIQKIAEKRGISYDEAAKIYNG